MGCWGITAFESDAGLDAMEFVRKNLPEDGKLELEKIIEALKHDGWNTPADVSDAESHTSPMALAEIMGNFMDGNIGGMDYDGEWAAKDKKFSAVTSFTASRESVQWLRDYLSDTLKYARENAEFKAGHARNGMGGFRKKAGLAGRSIWKHWSSGLTRFWQWKKAAWNCCPHRAVISG